MIVRVHNSSGNPMLIFGGCVGGSEDMFLWCGLSTHRKILSLPWILASGGGAAPSTFYHSLRSTLCLCLGCYF